MGLKRYTSNKDTTITNAFKENLSDRGNKANMGESDILELYSVYAQASSASIEKSRILVQFPIDKVKQDIDAGILPAFTASSAPKYFLKLGNAEHGQSAPSKYHLHITPIAQSWEEGYGLDMESYLDEGAANWLSASAEKIAQKTKIQFVSDNRSDYQKKYIMIYDGLDKKFNFWFKTADSDIAPVASGLNKEVDISGVSSATAYLTALSAKVAAIADSFESSLDASDSSNKTMIVTNKVKGAAEAPSRYNLTDSHLIISTSVSGSDAVKWNNEGGDYQDLDDIKYIDNSGDNVLSNVSKYIEHVDEDIEVDITNLVKEWYNGESSNSAFTAAEAKITITGQPANGATVTLLSTNQKSRVYRFSATETNATLDNDGAIFVNSTGTFTEIVTKFKNAIDSSLGHSGDLTAFVNSENTNELDLVQTQKGFGGNTRISVVGDSTSKIAVSSPSFFAKGSGSFNYGLGVMLSGSYEDGSLKRSFYTKKIFSRGSEFFFKRPTLEVRWADSESDDRGRLKAMHPQLSNDDNKLTMYFYNWVNGSLRDFATDGDADQEVVKFALMSDKEMNEKVSLPYTSNVGSATAKITITATTSNLSGKVITLTPSQGVAETFVEGSDWFRHADNTTTTAAALATAINASPNFSAANNASNVVTITSGRAGIEGHRDVLSIEDTADWAKTDFANADSAYTTTAARSSTGVYKAEFKIDYSFTGSVVYEKWWNAGDDGNVAEPGKYGASLIYGHHARAPLACAAPYWATTPGGYSPGNERPVDPTFVNHITNLKSEYSRNESARFRLFTRSKDWCPNIYTVASKKAEAYPVDEAYYGIHRVTDNYEVIPYATGSVEYTKLSYDVSGSYFDLDMSLFEPDYMYEISFLFKVNGKYYKQDDTFRFRIDKR